MTQIRKLHIRPYARLLTMLGDQLIKDEKIALVELIKNSYDADASWVRVVFQDFGGNHEINSRSKIIIEDDGHGMSEDLIRSHWLSPASPGKKKISRTKKGRVPQGEKGIGRFAALKLGRAIKITTKTEEDDFEHCVSCDFSRYGDEFLSEDGIEKDLLLEDLEVELLSREPSRIIKSKLQLGTRLKERQDHGTIIEISDLKGLWTEDKIKSACEDLLKLQPVFCSSTEDFEVLMLRDGELLTFHENRAEELKGLLEHQAVVKIEDGHFDSSKNEFHLKANGVEESISLLDPEITGLKIFNRHFGNAGSRLRKRRVQCGDFDFEFYVFDLSPGAPARHQLDKEDRQIVEDHGVYLYRDGIRVYPYGDPGDDWLGLGGDHIAKNSISKNQVTGLVSISKKNNPDLKDKTNREGLIDSGLATEDFLVLIKIILAYADKLYFKCRESNVDKTGREISSRRLLQKKLEELRETTSGNEEALEILSEIEAMEEAERSYLTGRIEAVEELAGVGLSVETASHDIVSVMGRTLSSLDRLAGDLRSGDELDREKLLEEIKSTRVGMNFIQAQLKDLQLLFKSSRRKRELVLVKEVLKKAKSLYGSLIEGESIKLIVKEIGEPLMVKISRTVLLQLFINLIDNSVYWLRQSSETDRQIMVSLDGNNKKMIFSDNGPGINEKDRPYVFEPFYSGKGEKGRGLGLHIARQLLERSDCSIELADEKPLPGASFIISFSGEEH